MKRIFLCLSICVAVVFVASLVLAGCAAPAPTSSPTTPPTTTPTTKPTTSPTASPTTKPTSTPTPTEAPWPKNISIGSSSSGTTTFVLGVKMASMITDYVKVPGKAEVNSGSAEALNLITNGQFQMAFSTPDVVSDAYLGTGTWATKGKQPIRTLFDTYATIMHQMTRASLNAKSIADLKGKRVFWTQPSSPSSKRYGETLFERYGMAPNDVISVKASSADEACATLKEEASDAIIYWGGLYASNYMQLSFQVPLTFIGLTADDQTYIQQKQPWMSKEIIPGGVYKGQSKTLLAMGQVYTMAIGRDMPDSLAYEITKQFWNHLEEFKQVHSTAGSFSLDKAVLNGVAPYHPGAIKYFKEKGVWGAEQDARQQALLKQIGATR